MQERVKQRQGVSFRPRSTHSLQTILEAAAATIPVNKIPAQPICLVMNEGEELSEVFNLID